VEVPVVVEEVRQHAPLGKTTEANLHKIVVDSKQERRLTITLKLSKVYRDSC
jgi:hypothetical protein